jgi:hypothetical protein
MTDRELLESIAQKVDGIEGKVNSIEEKATEHSEILQAVRHAQEIQMAKLDHLEIELAKLSGEQKESFQALADMYGQHELEISKLRRRSS